MNSKIACFFICLFILNCTVNKHNNTKRNLIFEFKPNTFELATKAYGIIKPKKNRLHIILKEGHIKINSKYTKFKTAYAYAIQLGISKTTAGQKHHNIIKQSNLKIIDKIFKYEEDYFDLSKLNFIINNIEEVNLKDARITLTIYKDSTLKNKFYVHSIPKNKASTLLNIKK